MDFSIRQIFSSHGPPKITWRAAIGPTALSLTCALNQCVLKKKITPVIVLFLMTFPECEPHSGSGLGVRAAETHTEEGGGDQGGRSVQDPAAAAGQTRQVCFFCFFLSTISYVSFLCDSEAAEESLEYFFSVSLTVRKEVCVSVDGQSPTRAAAV